MSNDKTRELVQKAYADVARKQSSCCGPSNSCCGGSKLYTVPDHPVPEAELGLSCGNPLAFGYIENGDVVLDLGSGTGKDVLLAAQKVGATGKAIGVDFTPEMLALARKNAIKFFEATGLSNVEFRESKIESLPVKDASVDLAISNCVINLSPDKPRVFREVHRVLRPGGQQPPRFLEDTYFSAAFIDSASLLNADFPTCGLFARDCTPALGIKSVTYRDTATGERWSWPAKPGTVFTGPSDFIRIL